MSLRTSIESLNFALPGFANFLPSSLTRIVLTSTRVIETFIVNRFAVQLPRSGVPSVWMCGLRPPFRHRVKLTVERRLVPLLYSRRILIW